jgi:hypothetical protein
MDLFILVKNRPFAVGIALLLTAALIIILVSASCVAPMPPDDYYRSQIAERSHPYAFSYISYELDKIDEALHNTNKDATQPNFEEVLKGQIVSVLKEHGIEIVPPLAVSIESPPHLLVVSPRDRILYFDRVVLEQDMTIAEQESLESSIDELGLSSLVLRLGGFGGTYPPIVTDKSSLSFIIDATVEEWLHQYLALKPLGFRYLLDSIGIEQDPDIITMNETAVGIVSREIGEEVYSRYYSDYISTDKPESDFDFDAEMRETRQQVDALLASGRIDEAEAYMEFRRQYFVNNGYNIRKLNQAYFAFHGIYGDSPAAVSPIYGELEQLRAESGSVKEFLDTVSSFRSYDDLKNSLQ